MSRWIRWSWKTAGPVCGRLYTITAAPACWPSPTTTRCIWCARTATRRRRSCGKLEAGEDPFEAARRELSEECGVTADRFLNLGVLYPTVGYDSEKIYIWAATGLHAAAQHLDEGEFLDVTLMPFEEVLDLVMTDQIRDSKTVAAVLKYALLRQKGEA